MNTVKKQTFVWNLDVPAEQLWWVLADTARFNEAAGFPKHDIEEIPQTDGSVEFVARAKIGPFTLVWDEEPQNWVENRWFRHRRCFRNGPISALCATLVICPQAGRSRAEYTVEIEAANPLGRLLLRTGLFWQIHRKFNALVADAAEFCRGRRDTEFKFKSPKLTPGARARGADIADRIEKTAHGHGLAAKLVDYVLSKPEVDVWSIRPLKLARLWKVPERHGIELCMEAVKQGLLRLRWDLLCPRCQVGKQTVAALKDLPDGAHCPSCNIDFKQEFSKNVELAFHPSTSIRVVDEGEYCLMGPITTPHIKLQLTVEAGGERTEKLDFAPGHYRVRTLEPGSETTIQFEGGGFPEISASDDGITTGASCELGTVMVKNQATRKLTFIIEELAWRRDALTAHRATTLQAFRDLFDDDVLRPGDDVEIDSITIMFTDLKGSTAMYDRIGDPRAYVLVRDHFEILGRVVRECNGTIVKMIGDAIMAVFADPTDGLSCGVRIHDEIERFNEHSGKEPIIIKLGLHLGKCISVTLNDKLDYYGSMPNMAARIQGESTGGDIVMSREFIDDPGVALVLKGFSPRQETARLKGFEQPAAYFRVTPEELSAKRQPDRSHGAGETRSTVM